MNPGDKVIGQDLGRCPFCEAKIAASDEAVMHAVPMCERFKALDPIDFLRAVREARESSSGGVA